MMNAKDYMSKAWRVFLEQGREAAIEYLEENGYQWQLACETVNKMIDKAYSVSIGSL
jgi:hypothetical protein